MCILGRSVNCLQDALFAGVFLFWQEFVKMLARAFSCWQDCVTVCSSVCFGYRHVLLLAGVYVFGWIVSC